MPLVKDIFREYLSEKERKEREGPLSLCDVLFKKENASLPLYIVIPIYVKYYIIVFYTTCIFYPSNNWNYNYILFWYFVNFTKKIKHL